MAVSFTPENAEKILNNAVALVPDSIRDENFITFAKLVEKRYASLDLSLLLVYLIDNVVPEALEELAWQFDVNGIEWQLADTEAKKRSIIKESPKIHKYKGTPYSLKRVLQILNIEGKIEEWQDYQGIPHHFRLNLNIINDRVDRDKMEKLKSLVEEYKSTRSILDYFQWKSTAKTPANVAALVVTTKKSLVMEKETENING